MIDECERIGDSIVDPFSIRVSVTDAEIPELAAIEAYQAEWTIREGHLQRSPESYLPVPSSDVHIRCYEDDRIAWYVTLVPVEGIAYACFDAIGEERLIALLCVLFYSAVFPFIKYATDLMVNKYGVEQELAGFIPSLLPLGTLFLTPFFGNLYDRHGKGASIMLLGAVMLIAVHLLFALPILNVWWFATAIMIVLGIAFSLVPSAMWPSVPKIIPEKQLGTAYALIFWVQNWGLMGVPALIGWVLDSYCKLDTTNGGPAYDYTLPMVIFMCFGIVALFVAILLKREDKKKGYGLELPNIK